MVFSTRDSDVHQTSFFFHLCIVKRCLRQREDVFFQSDEEYDREFEAFAGMYAHELDGFELSISILFDICHERHLFEKLGQKDHAILRIFDFVTVISRSYIYELTDIFVLFFTDFTSLSFYQVILIFNSSHQLLDQLCRRQPVCSLTKKLHRCHKLADRFLGRRP